MFANCGWQRVLKEHIKTLNIKGYTGCSIDRKIVSKYIEFFSIKGTFPGKSNFTKALIPSRQIGPAKLPNLQLYICDMEVKEAKLKANFLGNT